MDNTGFTLPPKLYDFLKFVAFVILPAAAGLVITVGSLVHWDGTNVTAGVLTAVDTFLGVILGKSSSNFKQNDPQAFGELVVKQDVDGTPMGLKVNGYRENPVFEAGSRVYLDVKREQLLPQQETYGPGGPPKV